MRRESLEANVLRTLDLPFQSNALRAFTAESLSRKGVSHKFILSSYVGQINFDDFIDYSRRINRVQDDAKEFYFDLGGHSVGAIYTDQPCVYWNVRILTVRTGSIRRASEIGTVPGDDHPILVQNELLQLPVLPSAFPKPGYMRAFDEAALAREQRQIRAEAFVNQELWNHLNLQSAT